MPVCFFFMQITLSADHYLYTAPGPEAPFSARVATPTAAVAPGALLWRRVGGNGTAERPVAGESPAVLLLERVAAVETVTAAGLVNPFTLRGAPRSCVWTSCSQGC